MVDAAAGPYRDERASYDLVGTPHRLDESDPDGFPQQAGWSPRGGASASGASWRERDAGQPRSRVSRRASPWASDRATSRATSWATGAADDGGKSDKCARAKVGAKVRTKFATKVLSKLRVFQWTHGCPGPS